MDFFAAIAHQFHQHGVASFLLTAKSLVQSLRFLTVDLHELGLRRYMGIIGWIAADHHGTLLNKARRYEVRRLRLHVPGENLVMPQLCAGNFASS